MSLIRNQPEPITKLGFAEVDYVNASAILNRATGFIDSYDYTLNPYKGCTFACQYCYAANFTGRAEDEWGDWVEVKKNALALLRKSKNLRDKKIYMAPATDPYQPIERKLELTRGILKILIKHQPKLVVQTRGPMVVRDLELLKQFHNLRVQFTITTDDDTVRKQYESRCASIPARFKAVAELARAEIPTTITLSPLLPVTSARNFAVMIGDVLPRGTTVIAQPLHPSAKKYKAGTREGTPENPEYEATVRELENYLREFDIDLVFGRAGFKCPL